MAHFFLKKLLYSTYSAIMHSDWLKIATGLVSSTQRSVLFQSTIYRVLYFKIKLSDWLKLVTWLALSNQRSILFQSGVVT